MSYVHMHSCSFKFVVIIAVAQLIQGQLGYRKVQLIKTEPLGTGSYGAVYKAMCDDLPCAAKILHPTLFQSNDPGATTVHDTISARVQLSECDKAPQYCAVFRFIPRPRNSTASALN